MGLLGRRILSSLASLSALAAPLAACYSPELEDCAVACASAADCGPGQACRSDGWCTGPDHAQGCGKPAPGGPGGPGGPDQDDASLQVVIEGQGQIEVEASSVSLKENCTSSSAGGTTCTYAMPAGTWAALRQKEQGGWAFEKWQAPGCGLGKPKSCLVLSGQGATSVVARFVER